MPLAGGSFGIVVDVDAVLHLWTLRRQVGRLRSVLSPDPRDRRSALTMPDVVRTLSRDLGQAPVFYLTGLPPALARPTARTLERDGYPHGAVVPTGRLLLPWWLFGGSARRKLAGLDRAAARVPGASWVLVGDDADHAPEAFARFAGRGAHRVAAIGLWRLLDTGPTSARLARLAGAPSRVEVVGAPNGQELLPRLRASLDVRPAAGGAVDAWLLTARERGDDATRLRPWTTGNHVELLLHGRTYLGALADELAATGPGDTVALLGWRGDRDELLRDHGPTTVAALTDAARRGAAVRGLLWHSHTRLTGYHTASNRALATAVNAAGGEMLLDQRVRALGSHHQKLVVVRRPARPSGDVALVGGIDVDHGSRDDARHDGDPQTVGESRLYGSHPGYHDLQLRLRGPAVGEAEQVFRERWDDPAALVRLPWHVLADRLHGLPRTASPLPAAAPSPPPAGRCAVQLLRTYPRRRPAYPFAPLGERSVARAYIKALGRAERLVYVEDQYLWSFDVARIFAAALRRAPRLHLIAVVPYRPDNQNPFYNGPASLGHDAALAMVHEAGGDRVQVLDVENHRGLPVYVHSKVCIVDDVWAAVGSANLNRRSWTHDSELMAAVLDEERDTRVPTDPAGLGDGARRFARDLRLALFREHLDRGPDDGTDDGTEPGTDDDPDLLDPDRAAETVRASAAAVEAWHDGGGRGPRPRGRLRPHTVEAPPPRLPVLQRWVTAPVYRAFLDPDGRPLGARLRRTY